MPPNYQAPEPLLACLPPKLEMEQVIQDIARNDGDRTSRPCRCCGTMWKPGEWNFYGLCDVCFAKFDSQKMAGRAAEFDGKSSPYFESADEWIVAQQSNAKVSDETPRQKL